MNAGEADGIEFDLTVSRLSEGARKALDKASILTQY
jgi:hypothetical protein